MSPRAKENIRFYGSAFVIGFNAGVFGWWMGLVVLAAWLCPAYWVEET